MHLHKQPTGNMLHRCSLFIEEFQIFKVQSKVKSHFHRIGGAHNVGAIHFTGQSITMNTIALRFTSLSSSCPCCIWLLSHWLLDFLPSPTQLPFPPILALSTYTNDPGAVCWPLSTLYQSFQVHLECSFNTNS